MFEYGKTLSERAGEQFRLYEQYVNPALVKLFELTLARQDFRRAEGAYLYDAAGNQYLDFHSGWGAAWVGRGNPVIKRALTEAIASDLPNVVGLDCSLFGGLLAEKLTSLLPAPLRKVYFGNSGTEAIEAALKLTRRATGRPRILYCDSAFHGLTYGSLSLCATTYFREGYGPLLPGCAEVPFGDAEALERELRSGDVAAFVIEPIQGKGIAVASREYLTEVRRLCDRHGTMLVFDEVQTGLGRTGRMFALEHANVVPDVVTISKALSGNYVPVGACIFTDEIYRKVFRDEEQAWAHTCTFSANTLAMVAGLATLAFLEEHKAPQRAEELGKAFVQHAEKTFARHPLVKQIRGRGLMIGVEFHQPLDVQVQELIVTPLMRDHRILAQETDSSAANGVLKLLPPVVATDDDLRRFAVALEQVVHQAASVLGR